MEKNYQQAVDDIAEEAFKQYTENVPYNQRDEYISESVDGSWWIIYFAGHEEVLQSTDHEPDGAEVREMAPADADWRKMRQIAAYIAMERDVREALDSLARQSVA